MQGKVKALVKNMAERTAGLKVLQFVRLQKSQPFTFQKFLQRVKVSNTHSRLPYTTVTIGCSRLASA